MSCLQVIFADSTGVVQASLWPPSSRFHGLLSSAPAQSSGGCFPLVKMNNFEVRVQGRFGSTRIVKLGPCWGDVGSCWLVWKAYGAPWQSMLGHVGLMLVPCWVMLCHVAGLEGNMDVCGTKQKISHKSKTFVGNFPWPFEAYVQPCGAHIPRRPKIIHCST